MERFSGSTVVTESVQALDHERLGVVTKDLFHGLRDLAQSTLGSYTFQDETHNIGIGRRCPFEVGQLS